MIFRILAILLFVVIIGGSIWLGGTQREVTSTTTLEPSNVDLGYSARNATLVETGVDGLPMYTLQAEVIRQHPGDGERDDQRDERDSGDEPGETVSGVVQALPVRALGHHAQHDRRKQRE